MFLALKTMAGVFSKAAEKGVFFENFVAPGKN